MFIFRARSRVNDAAKKREARKKKKGSAGTETDTSEGIFVYIFGQCKFVCVCFQFYKCVGSFGITSRFASFGIFRYNHYQNQMILTDGC